MKTPTDNAIKVIEADEQLVIRNYGGTITKDTTNGDIFRITRVVEMDASKSNLKVKNTTDIYFWFIKYRDAIAKRDAAKDRS